MPVVQSEYLDPYINLSIEELLLDRAAELGPTLILWSSSPSVVLGRHQNPWVECNLQEMKREKVLLVRRISGGGTVYHDPGNINFSFVLPESLYDQEKQFEVVLQALRHLGVSAVKNERNDLCVGSRKFSGNAFRHSKGNSLHHGTLLLNADIEALTRFLEPPELGIETKAIASVRSQVINLEESVPGLAREAVVSALAEEFVRVYEPSWSPQGSIIRLRESVPQKLGAVADWWPEKVEIETRAKQLAAWEWVFGHTPAFTRRYTQAGAAVTVVIKKGAIQSIELDDGAADALWSAAQPLVGVELRREEVEHVACDEPARWLQQALLKDLW